MSVLVESAAVISQHLSIERAHIEELQAEGPSGNDAADDGVGPEKPVRHLYADLPHAAHFQSFAGQEEHARLADLVDFSRNAMVSGDEAGIRPVPEKMPVKEAAPLRFLFIVR